MRLQYPNRIEDHHTLVTFRSIIDAVNSVDTISAANASAIAQIHVPTIAEIQAALSLGGSNPINVTGLQGSLANSQIAVSVGLFAARPLPSSVPAGVLYFATDQSTVYISTGAAWDTITRRILFNGGFFAIFAATLGADRTYTFPDSSDIIVLLTAIQTLTNKKIGDPSDPTKALAFTLSGATTAKTMTLVSAHTDNRSVTLPDATGTLAYETSPLTADLLIIGAGVSKVATLGTPGSTTTVLHGNGAGPPTFAAVDLAADVTGVLPIANGGTGSAAAIYKPLFDHFADAGNGTTVETDLYSDTIAAGQLSSNGDKLAAEYSGIYVFSATASRQVRIYFGGTLVYDTAALTLGAAVTGWQFNVAIIRKDASTARVSTVAFTTTASAVPYWAYVEVTATLSSSQILKITGQAGGVGAATNDIVAKMGKVVYTKAA